MEVFEAVEMWGIKGRSCDRLKGGATGIDSNRGSKEGSGGGEVTGDLSLFVSSSEAGSRSRRWGWCHPSIIVERTGGAPVDAVDCVMNMVSSLCLQCLQFDIHL